MNAWTQLFLKYNSKHVRTIKSKITHTQLTVVFVLKKNLKIPKGQSESVYRRKTDNTMAKRKSNKGQRTIYNTFI